MRSLLLAALLAIAVPAHGGDFDYGAYRTARLADIAAGLQIDPRVRYWLDAAHPKYHAVAVYTGRTRVISPGVQAFVKQWASAMQHPVATQRMFVREIEVQQGGVTYWMPIQQALVAPLAREVPAGREVHLYLLLMGAYNRVPVFAVNEFDATGR